MKKPEYGQTRRQGGLSLIPDLWAAIDKSAARAGVPRNRVIETILMREFGFLPNSQKTSENRHDVEDLVELAG